MWENLVGNLCGKILQEKEEILREKANLRKAVIGGNLAFGNRVMREPINAGKSCAGKSCGQILQEILAGNLVLQENLVGKGGGEKANLRKAVIGGNLAFGIG